MGKTGIPSRFIIRSIPEQGIEPVLQLFV